MTTVVIVVLALAVFAVAEGLYYFISYLGQREREELRRRLKAAAHAGSSFSLLRERKMARTPGVAQILEPLSFAQALERLLLQTDLSMTVAALLGISTAVGLGSALLVFILLKKGALIAVLMFPLGFSIPIIYVYGERGRRSRKLSEQLPDALEMMARSLRAGHSIGSGFKLVTQEMGAPIAVEFGRCFEEQNAGVTLRDSINHLTERVPDNLDLKIFAVSVVIQSETGGNLIEILDQISTTIRERFKFYGKLRALTAEARLSGIILAALPFFCGVLMLVVRPQYFKPMFADPIGLLIFFAGLTSWIFGAFWMRKLSQVDY